MGLDAKGRNFSAPRLTPGKSSELLVYGSPNMLNDQARQMAIMDERARRYGFGGIKSVNSNTLGLSSSISNSLSSVSFGTQVGSTTKSYTAKPITTDSNPNHNSTMTNSTRGYYASRRTQAKQNTAIFVVIALLVMMFAPYIFAVLSAIIIALTKLFGT